MDWKQGAEENVGIWGRRNYSRMKKLQNQEIRNLFPLPNKISTLCNNVVMVLYAITRAHAHAQVASSIM
jgi:hypothetical protein